MKEFGVDEDAEVDCKEDKSGGYNRQGLLKLMGWCATAERSDVEDIETGQSEDESDIKDGQAELGKAEISFIARGRSDSTLCSRHRYFHSFPTRNTAVVNT